MYRNIYLKLSTFQLRIITVFIVFMGIVMTASAQQTISGRVTDETNGGIPGVSVTIKGQSKGATTNTKGEYTLTASAGQTLVFTYVGYAAKEAVVGASATININLSPNSNDLTEVVVVGYGTAKKGDLTGSIAGIGSKEIEDCLFKMHYRRYRVGCLE